MSSIIQDYGDEKRPIWIIKEEPYAQDEGQGFIFSGGFGFSFKKVCSLGGLNMDDMYISSIRPCLGTTYNNPDVRLTMMLQRLEQFKPPLIIVMDDGFLNYLVPQTTQAKEKNSSLRKWAGSLLQSKFLTYPHYIIALQPPDYIARNWDEHEIQAFIHLGHVKEEFEFFKKNNFLQSLPQRNLVTEPAYDTLVDYLRYLSNSYSSKLLSFISTDIETIRPKKDSFYHIQHHPGFPYTIALAPSAKEAMSFSFWDYTTEQNVQVWRLLNKLFQEVPLIGQNFFGFDTHYLEALGFNFNFNQIQDTLIRHHILWPGLPHKLQFQTLQYTREPYYKDEGRNWSSKFKRSFMVYNAKDACCTYEVFEKQEEEFLDRPFLK